MTKLGVGIQGDNITDQIQGFEQMIERPVKVVRRYQKWEDPLVDDTALWAAQTGHDAIIALESFTAEPNPRNTWSSNPGVRWTDIADGVYDDDLAVKMQQLKDLATAFPEMTIYFVFHHEPEDDTDDIAAQGACGSGPEEFLDASQYVRLFARASGVPFRGPKGKRGNVLFGHCLMGATYRGGHGGPTAWYPADMRGIQFVATDGYNRGPYEQPKPKWRTFTDVFGAAHSWATVTERPLVIEECGLPENNVASPSKAGWFDDAASVMKGWTNLEVFMYSHVFSTNYNCDYHVDTSQSSLAEYRKLAHDPAFRS